MNISQVIIENGRKKYNTVPGKDGIIHVNAAKGSGLLTIKLDIPIIDINGYWHPDCRWPSAKLNFNIHFTSAFNRFWPLISFFSQSGNNRCTVGITDMIDDCDINASLDQSACAYHLVFTVVVPENEDIHFDLSIDTTDGLWTDAVKRQVTRIAKVYPAPQIPEAAWEPVYCTWYAAHAAVTQQWVDEIAPITADIGFKTLILDDGWCFPEMRRAVIENGEKNWYKDIGDWELCKEKFPDFPAHLARIHKLGMKYMFWTTPILIGINSKIAAKYDKNGIDDTCIAGFRLPNFTNDALSEEMIEKIIRVLKDNNLDGLKIDFIDKVRPSLTEPCGRKMYNFIKNLISKLKAVKPDMLIEFRESYCHRGIAFLCTQYRAADVPLDWMDNLRRLAKIHMELGQGFPVHSDPACWHKDELPENVSRHMIAAIAGVPMLSVDLKQQSAENLAIIRHWLIFYKQHIDTFKKGQWQSRYFGENLCYLKVASEKECIVFLIDDARFSEVEKDADIILNLSSVPLCCENAEYFNSKGEVVADAAVSGGGLIKNYAH